MNVAALQEHLRDLADFLGKAGSGATVVKDLNAIADGLSPFAGEKVEAFAAFLAQADEYRRIGVFTTTKGRKSPAAPKATTPPPSVDEVKGKVAALYDHAQTATDAKIDEVLNPLEKLFKLPELKAIAAAAKVEGKVSKVTAKGKVVAEIRRAIVDSRGMAERSDQ